MAEQYIPDAISVLITEVTDDKLTLAEFQWQKEQPITTYTIDVNPCISIELSNHFPVRPTVVRWEHRGRIGEDALLEQLFGSDFSEAMKIAHSQIGFMALNLTLSLQNRLEISQLQLVSPSTPTILKHACASMSDELRQKYKPAA